MPNPTPSLPAPTHRLFTRDEVTAYSDPRDHLSSPFTEESFPVEFHLSEQPGNGYDPMTVDAMIVHPVVLAVLGDRLRSYTDLAGQFFDLCNGRQILLSQELPGEFFANFLYTLGEDGSIDCTGCGVFSC